MLLRDLHWKAVLLGYLLLFVQVIVTHSKLIFLYFQQISSKNVKYKIPNYYSTERYLHPA